MAPFDASFIVVIDWCWEGSVVDGEATDRKVQNHVARVDGEARTHVCCPNFGLA